MESLLNHVILQRIFYQGLSDKSITCRVSGMKMLYSINEVCASLTDEPLALTIGNFDGVHLGHRALLKDLELAAQSYGLKSLVMTFSPHPRAILQPDHPFRNRLFSIEDLKEQMSQLHVDGLWIETFNKELSELAPEEFISKYLTPLNIKFLLVGHDFRFGKQRSGGLPQLLEWAKEKSVQIKVFNPYLENDQRVSTSLIRELLLQGKVEEVAHYLGRKFTLEGAIEHGHKVGQGMGFPTANINISAPILNGVYITEVGLEGKLYPAVTNVGLRPTVNTHWDILDRNVETYILGEDLDLYGKNLKVHFHTYLRPEKKFDSLEALRAQITKDVELAAQYFGLEPFQI